MMRQWLCRIRSASFRPRSRRRSRSGDIIGPDQRVDPITALKAMTIWPAYQYFEDDQKGSIEVGKLADLVILSEDPTAIDSESLYRIKVVETIKEGQSVYRIGDDKLPKKASLDTDPVGNLLRGMAVSRDAARYASYPIQQGAQGHQIARAPHDTDLRVRRAVWPIRRCEALS